MLYCESNVDGTIGGSHHCLLHLVQNLDRSRFEPTVVFYEDHALIDAFRAVAETLVLPQDQPVQWGASAAGPWASIAGFARRAVNGLKIVRSVLHRAMFLRRRGFALVHLNNSITCHHEWMLAALIAGVPCIVHERGLSPAYSWPDRILARRLALVIPMSRWIQDHMVERGVSLENSRVMYDGLDPNTRVVATPAASVREAWNVQPGQPVCGIVGNLREWKGQETVVRALIDVTRVYPEIVCFFVGAWTPADEPFVARLRALIGEHGIGRNVRFTHYRKDVPDFINIMHFVIHASILPEPFGMVVLEAMAQRKAVIGSRAGGVVEMVVEGQTGYTFPPGDWRALADQMLRLLAEPERATRMGGAGYDRLISSFTMERYMADIHSSYHAILNRHPVPSGVGQARSTNGVSGSLSTL